ncbi:hypothetical protein [Phenylobacterium sp.]|uniref:hypothetical protein n=1 Tax=Phenylobacterium sp. TaxID=1871053 RepID=UPI002E2EDEE7|nr:hypothetical protein [Phenylobacterium sp.]HEX3364011.1 hypothetical protein [Phenylobacterium sp.]
MNRKPPDSKGRKPGGFGSNRKPPDPKAAAKRAALNALKRAQRQADRAGVKLSEWEGEFLGSVSDRLKTYGRAFGDPEKGAPGQALSALQTVKLKEITAKAKGEKKELKRKPFKRRGAPPE